jgi:hypothetical protein
MTTMVQMGCPTSTDELRKRLLSEVCVSGIQGARLAGITPRQLLYWADKGIIPSRIVGSRRMFSLEAIEKAAIIGLNLRQQRSIHEVLDGMQFRNGGGNTTEKA